MFAGYRPRTREGRGAAAPPRRRRGAYAIPSSVPTAPPRACCARPGRILSTPAGTPRIPDAARGGTARSRAPARSRRGASACTRRRACASTMRGGRARHLRRCRRDPRREATAGSALAAAPVRPTPPSHTPRRSCAWYRGRHSRHRGWTRDRAVASRLRVRGTRQRRRSPRGTTRPPRGARRCQPVVAR